MNEKKLVRWLMLASKRDFEELVKAKFKESEAEVSHTFSAAAGKKVYYLTR